MTTLSSRRETQRRAAVAALALIVVAGSLGLGVWYLGGHGGSPSDLGSLTAGQKALMQAKTAIEQVYAPGVNLVRNDPPRATDLLTKAWQQLETAAGAGIPASAIDPLRAQARTGLDELYKMESVPETTLFSFADSNPPVDLKGVALGPDKAPYVLDGATHSVYRVDLKGGKATPVYRLGQSVGGVKVAEPRFITPAGPDLLILDTKNALWRWRPADRTGKGTLARVKVKDSASWGDDIRGIGSFVRNADQGLYNLYIVDPSAKQIQVYTPAFDGSGFPADPSGWLAAPQDVATVDSMVIDGDIYLSRAGTINRFVRGGNTSWKPGEPGDGILRAAPVYSLVASGTDKGAGAIYGYDRGNRRIVGLAKDGGSIEAQYRLASDEAGWADLRGMYVLAGTDTEPDTLVWIDKNRLMSSLLEGVQAPSASPSPSAGASPSAAPSPTPRVTKKPKKTPKP